ncbi:MAG: hypothetical protein JW871_02525 [Endomicrobiales bacterium]|nr:hypothetical protein [Endomicrobiales bacterium]
MKKFLSKSVSSLNQNKLNGILAEIEFRNYLSRVGFSNRVSVGGWIARCDGPGLFGHNTIVVFPSIIKSNFNYPVSNNLPTPALGLHTICATFRQIGIKSYFCTPQIAVKNNVNSIQWKAIELGLPNQQTYKNFPNNITGFRKRLRNYNFLRYKTKVNKIPVSSLPEEFSKEHLRVQFQNAFFSEMSDVDGIIWGQQYTYPVEIKEKTAAHDPKLGDYFGLDVGPFVKLAFYAAKRGNLHSIFVVREIDNTIKRNLVQWWYIKFDKLAQYASWKPIGGGRNMQGGNSTVIQIPKSEFSILNRTALNNL